MADGGILENAPVIGVKKTFPRSFGRYILEKSLSRGGMGEVFLTIAKAVWRRCVIKTIRGDLTGDEEFIGRFADEAKIMMRIQHPNIIRVFDAGKVGTDYYIAMEYVHGRDLGDVLDRAYERGEPMPTHLGLYIADKLLDGLDYAHKLCDEHGRHMGLVHRDISPQNVLIGFDGSVKLIDFGLARTDLLPARTQGALAVGKYGYMSPEQARHERIDGRADIYSTGVMLFEVFTGDRLVDEQDQATLWQRVLNPKHRKPTSVVRELQPEIDDLIMTAVSVKAEDRFSDAGAMRSFVQKLQRSDSNREELVRYLRYLYPKVDFEPPPMPDYTGQFNESEKSLIIATSREGAMTVFGRGELPIEWTTQIDAADLQATFSKYRERVKKEIAREVPTDTAIPNHPSDGKPDGRPDGVPMEPTWVRRSADDSGLTQEAASVETRIRSLVEPPPADSELMTAVNNTQAIDEDEPRPEAGLGTTRVATHFRDDERTVMMDAPPRSMLRARGQDRENAEAPTRLSLQVPDVSAAQAAKGRAILEKTRDREKNESSERDGAKERTKDRPTPDKKSARAMVHRTTVPSDIIEAASGFADSPSSEKLSALAEKMRPRALGRYAPALIVVGVLVAVFLALWAKS